MITGCSHWGNQVPVLWDGLVGQGSVFTQLGDQEHPLGAAQG